MTKDDCRAQEFVLEDVYLKRSTQKLDVAVVIPNHNGPHFCAQAIDSLDAGRFALGVLVLDDGSSVENYERLKTSLSANQSHIDEIRVVRTQNIGAYQSRLFAVSLASSTYIKFLDQDDVLLPGILEKEIDHANMSGATVLMTDWEEIWLNDQSDSKVIRHSAPDYGDPILGFLTEGGVFTSAALYRRCAFDQVQAVTSWKPRLSDDWVIFGQVLLRVVELKGSYSTLHELSYQWRHHSDQQSADSPIGHTKEFYEFLFWFEDELRKSGELASAYKHALASYYTKNALFICYSDPKAWKKVTVRINALCVDGVVWREGGALIRLMVRWLGIYGGVRVYVMLKQLVRPFPFAKNSA